MLNGTIHYWSSLRQLIRELCRFGCIAANQFLESVSGMWIEIHASSFFFLAVVSFHASHPYNRPSHTKVLNSLILVFRPMLRLFQIFFRFKKMLLVPTLGVSWCLLYHHSLLSQSRPGKQSLRRLRLPLTLSWRRGLSDLTTPRAMSAGSLCSWHMLDWTARWGSRLNQHRLGSHINPLREGKLWQKTTGHPGYGGWAVGEWLAPGKPERLPKL